MLFNGEYRCVLRNYERRFLDIIREFEGYNAENYFMEIPDYWQLSTLKTVDLMIGENSIVTADKDAEKNKINELLSNEHIDFSNRLQELIIDNDIYGEAIARIYNHKDMDGKTHLDFVIVDPSTWFPVVDRENVKKIKYHVIASLECVGANEQNPAQNKYDLNVQIHTVGQDKYIQRRYAISNFKKCDWTHKETEQFFSHMEYEIGDLLEEREVIDQIKNNIILFTGTTTAKSLYGKSAYERITPIIAELSLRKSLRNYILDKNATPRMSAPESAFVTDQKTGMSILRTGGNTFVVGEGENPPQYITWDGNLTSNENAIKDLEKDLFSLSEMGALIDNSDLNSSQGREALRIKLTNPVAKVKRMCRHFILPLKTLVGRLTDIEPADITINFNPGLPLDESEILDNATKAKNIGMSQKTIFTKYFGLEDSEAEKEIEQEREENADSVASQINFMRENGTTDEDGGDNE